jgi:hypothetical protein
MRGRWSPKGAKRDFEDHERRVEAELAKLRTEAPRTEVPDVPIAV